MHQDGGDEGWGGVGGDRGRSYEPAGQSCHPMARGVEETASASGCLEVQGMCAQSELSQVGLSISESWLQEQPQGP